MRSLRVVATLMLLPRSQARILPGRAIFNS